MDAYCAHTHTQHKQFKTAWESTFTSLFHKEHPVTIWMLYIWGPGPSWKAMHGQ